MDHQPLSSLLIDAVRRNVGPGEVRCESAEIDSGEVAVTTVTVRLNNPNGETRVLLGTLLDALNEHAGPNQPVNLELFAQRKTIALSGKIGGRNFSVLLQL